MNKHSYQIEINAGKWGVGKSTISASKALFSALEKNEKTLLVDMDGGKALARVIDLYQYSINEIGPTHINNLDFASIQSLPYFTARRDLDTFEMYMDQFPGDYGLIAFNDMLHEFFGVTTDIDGLQKFIVLSNILQWAKDEYNAIIIDVEPTMGLSRLIESAERVARSVHNLSRTGFLKLQALWAVWPDIKSYLQSGYIKKSDYYMGRVLDTKHMILSSKFSVVTIPEPEPIEQIKDIIALIDSIKWVLSSVIVNNTGRAWKILESDMIDRIDGIVAKRPGVALKKIPHTKSMFDWTNRVEVLTGIGASLAQQ